MNNLVKTYFQMESYSHTNLMTDEEYCKKVCDALEVLADKLRNPDIGQDLWTEEGIAFKTLIVQMRIILKKAAKLSSSSKKNISKEDDWPEIIYE
jgi:hypothetical protein